MINKQRIQRVAISSGLALALSSSAHAAVIVGWENEDANDGNPSWESLYNDANLASSMIGVGADLTTPATGGPGAGAAMKYEGLATTTDTVAEAVTNNSYIGFTVVAQSGFQFDATEIVIADINMSEASTVNIDVRSSIDGFASTLATLSTTSNAEEGPHRWDLGTAVVNQTSVDFRFYFYWDSAAAGNDGTNFHLRDDKTNPASFAPDDFTGTGLTDPLVYINGTVNAVPEPSSTVLIGLGALTLVLRRRK